MRLACSVMAFKPRPGCGELRSKTRISPTQGWPISVGSAIGAKAWNCAPSAPKQEKPGWDFPDSQAARDAVRPNLANRADLPWRIPVSAVTVCTVGGMVAGKITIKAEMTARGPIKAQKVGAAARPVIMAAADVCWRNRANQKPASSVA